MKKILSLTVCAALLLASFASLLGVSAAEYTDISGHWGKNAITEWSGYGVVQGSDGKFRPNDSITRAEMATVIAKLLKLDDKAANSFSDLSAGAWYTDNVLKCAKAGIINGYSDKTFKPQNKITRQEAIVMLGRALGVTEDKSADISSFKDASLVQNWAEGYVKAMIGRKIVNGVSADTLALSASINRASVVTILSNAIDEYITEGKTVTLSADNTGITLVVSTGVTLKGETEGEVLIAGGAKNGKTVIEANINKVTVKADNAEVELKGAAVRTLALAAEGAKYTKDAASTIDNIEGGTSEAPSDEKDPKEHTVSPGGGSGTHSSNPDALAPYEELPEPKSGELIIVDGVPYSPIF